MSWVTAGKVGGVVVFSMGKPELTCTAEWFKRYDFCEATYVLSPGDDVEGYRRSTGCQVVVSDSHNLPSKRQWAVDHFTSERRPWLLFFEDNILRVTGVAPEYYGREKIEQTSRHIYHSNEYGPQSVLSRMVEDLGVAEAAGAAFGGFASNDNHFFRKRKYRRVAFVWTKMAYCRRGGPPWPVFANEKDDYAYTAECLLSSGRVLVNNYLYAWPRAYEGRGGSRTIEDRAPDRRAAVAEFMVRYPGLYRIKDRPGRPAGTEVQMRFCNERQVDLWREKLNS